MPVGAQPVEIPLHAGIETIGFQQFASEEA